MQLYAIFVLVLLVVSAIACLREPSIGLGLVWSTYAIEQFVQPHFSWFYQHGWFFNTATVSAALAGSTLAFLRGKYNRLKAPAALWLFLLLLGYAAASAFWSVNRGATLSHLAKNAPYLIGIGIIAPLTINSLSSLKTAIRMVLILGVFLAIGLFFSKVHGRHVVVELQGSRSPRQLNPLAVGSFAGYLAICALVTTIDSKHKLIRFAIAVLAIYLVVRSGSRGQLLAVLVALGAVMPFMLRISLSVTRRSALIGVFGIVTVSALLLAGSYYFIVARGERSSQRWTLDTMVQTFESTRFVSVSYLFEHYAEEGPATWLMGLGSSGSYAVLGSYPHVVPAEILCELGLIGLMIYLTFIVVSGRSAIRLLRAKDLPIDVRRCIGAVTAVFLMELILGFKQGSMLGSSFFFSLGILLSWLDTIRMSELRVRQQATNRSLGPVARPVPY